jgi:hypothetical protein
LGLTGLDLLPCTGSACLLFNARGEKGVKEKGVRKCENHYLALAS